MSYNRSLVFSMLVVILCHEAETTIVAKSDITICENSAKDPLNVLYNTKCEKKLVVVAQVLSGQGETERLYATVKKVYDRVEEEDARLYNPFVITLSMSPISLVYPIYYRATVNNKPYENVKYFILPDKHADYACSQGCDPKYDDDGAEIYDSQGFCCVCDDNRFLLSKFGNYFDTLIAWDDQYQRSSLDCSDVFAAGHCMIMDHLWYDVHEIGTFRFDFTIWVKAYDQVEKQEGNRTKIEWVDGGQIALSPQKTAGVGKYGRIIAKYIGKLSSGVAYPRLEDHYMMIPNPSKLSFGFDTHPQLKHGYQDYLIIPVHRVEFNNSQTCDIIGVTYSAFAQQSQYHSGSGYGCHQKRGTCLRNQIKDLFYEDLERRETGSRTKYFPESYGRIMGMKKQVGTDDRVVEFESSESSSVQVYLEISADDLILIYNRATGIIVKAYAEEFEAHSRNGIATVIVQNTGYITAGFYVTLESCSEGIRAGNELSGSINPQVNFEFNFRLEAYQAEGGSFSCTARLYDSRRYLVDSSVISVNTTSTCICILNCGCSCSDQNYRCINESDVEFDQTKPRSISDFMDRILPKIAAVFNKIGGFFKGAFGFFKTLWGLKSHIGTIFAVIGVIILLCICRMGCSIVPTGVMLTVIKTAIKKSKPKEVVKPPAPTIVIIHKENESDSEDSEKETGSRERNAKTGQAQQTTTISEFLFEFFFFFILPFLLLFKLLKRLANPAWRWLYETFHIIKNNDDELSENEFSAESGEETETDSNDDDSTSDENHCEVPLSVSKKISLSTSKRVPLSISKDDPPEYS